MSQKLELMNCTANCHVGQVCNLQNDDCCGLLIPAYHSQHKITKRNKSTFSDFIMKNERTQRKKEFAKVKRSKKCTPLDFSSFFRISLNNFCEKMLAWLVWQPWVWPEGAAELYQPMGTASDKKATNGKNWQ